MKKSLRAADLELLEYWLNNSFLLREERFGVASDKAAYYPTFSIFYR